MLLPGEIRRRTVSLGILLLLSQVRKSWNGVGEMPAFIYTIAYEFAEFLRPDPGEKIFQ